MDDSGNPIFSQEGNVDMDSLLKELFADNKELKSIVSDKLEKVLDTIKLDNKALSDTVVKSFGKLFDFSATYKKEIQATIKSKVEDLLDGIKLDGKAIGKNIESLFEYKDKDKQLKSVFDKINTAVSENLSFSSKTTKGEKGEKSINATITHIDPNVLKAVIMDANVLDIDSGILKILSNTLSEDYVNKTKTFLEPHLISIIEALEFSKKENEKTKGEKTGGDGGDTVFEEEPKPVIVWGFSVLALNTIKDLMEKLGVGGTKKPEKEEESEKGGVLGMLGRVLGISSLGGSIAKMGGLVMSTLTSLLKLPMQALKFATNPLTLLIGGLIWGVFDGVKAALGADKWGTSKSGAFIGGFLAGGEGIGGLFKNMGKWAMIGVGVGMIGGPIGMLIGGLVGVVLGGLLNAIGAEKIAKTMDKFASWFSGVFGGFIDSLKNKWDAVVGEFKSVWERVTFWFEDDLMPAVNKFKADLEPIVQRISGFINEKLIPDLKRFFNFISPVFEAIQYGITEWIWPGIKKVGAYLGDVLVKLFENLGPIIDRLLDVGGKAYDGIVWGFEQIGKALGWLGDKIGKLAGYVTDWWKGDEFEQEEKELRRIDKRRQDQQKELDKAREHLENAEKEQNQKKIQRYSEELAVAQEKIRKDAEFEKQAKEKRTKQAELNKQQYGLTTSVIEGTPIIPVQDLVVNYANPKATQFQLDSRDTMERIGNTDVYSKSGGTLDKAIGELKELLSKQLSQLENAASTVERFLSEVANNTLAINENLPLLMKSGNSEAPVPAELAIPNGYIRDPIYEYRMKIRAMGI